MYANLNYLHKLEDLSCPPDSVKTWLRPVNLVSSKDPVTKYNYFKLANGWRSFDQIDVIVKNREAKHLKFDVCRTTVIDYLKKSTNQVQAEENIHNFISKRNVFSNLKMDTPNLMGVLNNTPDSFSDKMSKKSFKDLIKFARKMKIDGASCVDVGGESSRPGADYVSFEEEKKRVLPLIKNLDQEGIIVSIDTRKNKIMELAMNEGASIVNDVTGFRKNDSMDLIVNYHKSNPMKGNVIIMHMQGNPKNMQDKPNYNFAPIDIFEFLKKQIVKFVEKGLPIDKIVIDPGFGFGKNIIHNLELMNWLSMFHGLGVPILIGISRKSMIAKLSNNEPTSKRLPGSIALTLNAVKSGVQLIRTHEIKDTLQAIKVELGLNFN